MEIVSRGGNARESPLPGDKTGRKDALRIPRASDMIMPMGYEVYITRAKSHRDKRQSPILQSEWDQVVKADPELETSTEDFYERTFKGKDERVYSVILTNDDDERVPFLLL